MYKLIVLSLFAGNTAFGQLPKNPSFQLPLVQSNVKKGQELFKLNMNEVASAWQGKFSYTTTNGSSIYFLPPDRMDCVVPDRQLLEKMPTGSLLNRPMADGMPNAFPKVQIIPNEGKIQ